jgi:hypothetical protein
MRLLVCSKPLAWDTTDAALPAVAREVRVAFAGTRLAHETPKDGELWLAIHPRGLGPDAWSGDARKQTHLRRRFMLLGQTVDGMRVWDIRQTVRALNQAKAWRGAPLTVEAHGFMAVNALYAAAFLPSETAQRSLALELHSLPASHRDGPDYLNVMKILDVPQAVLLAASACEEVRIGTVQPAAFAWPMAAALNLRWPERRLQIP